jgi:predicted GH43/DUF377 family glycosyl hydrolase
MVPQKENRYCLGALYLKDPSVVLTPETIMVPTETYERTGFFGEFYQWAYR